MTAKPSCVPWYNFTILLYVHCQVTDLSWLFIHPAMSQDINTTHFLRKATEYNFSEQIIQLFKTQNQLRYLQFSIFVLFFLIVKVHCNCRETSRIIKGIQHKPKQTSSVIKSLLFFRKLEQLKRSNKNHTDEQRLT